MGETSEKRKRNRKKQLKREEKEDKRWLKREEKARQEGPVPDEIIERPMGYDDDPQPTRGASKPDGDEPDA